MSNNTVGAAQSARNIALKAAASGLICKWSKDAAMQGTAVAIQVKTTGGVYVSSAVINIYQNYDNRSHPIEAFKVSFENGEVNFDWSTKAANGATPEKGPIYFEAMVAGVSKGKSGALHLQGKAEPKKQETDFQKKQQISSFHPAAPKNNMPKF